MAQSFLSLVFHVVVKEIPLRIFELQKHQIELKFLGQVINGR
jgi:hypothetical protein